MRSIAAHRHVSTSTSTNTVPLIYMHVWVASYPHTDLQILFVSGMIFVHSQTSQNPRHVYIFRIEILSSFRIFGSFCPKLKWARVRAGNPGPSKLGKYLATLCKCATRYSFTNYLVPFPDTRATNTRPRCILRVTRGHVTFHFSSDNSSKGNGARKKCVGTVADKDESSTRLTRLSSNTTHLLYLTDVK